ncbi:MAG: protein-(glutamine-N5) methyltransferase, release factor-specific [Alphaproteobacteria bacterium 16-39-46]|nr:MAG: protein-(glutamine-N5) methyltransferase, release factor-specific [Alphaproteobacteria bacterium 16-39-46]OZA43599.1 MAG: protein-(glutamine-N5) methyltransferase, release factor-specific [Alphaproteobacteria bacterium 17-39-52]HQS83750.1 peptide chain release factor N(5)-glutamine methyltransferase [Alphaproteobacteria bacterium]HQS93540.1 peptide chain release factor N(5)-glutamine methyltransferase [Alphaproteobacteria bacterium]
MNLTLEQALSFGQETLLASSLELSPAEAFKKARLLLAHVLKKDPSYLYGFSERVLSAQEQTLFKDLILKAIQGMPLSRILEQREFWSLPFSLNVATLDPRPDSEVILDVALNLLKGHNTSLRILDLGTGSGCLLLSLLHMLPNAEGVGVDLSFKAALCARQNAFNLDLSQRASFIQGSWTEALSGKFDLIVSNPPYIPTSEIPHLDPSVRLFDPFLALDGGIDGLDPYRNLIPKFKDLLSPKGFVLVEIGSTQSFDVEKIFQAENFQNIMCYQDIERRPRVISAYV